MTYKSMFFFFFWLASVSHILFINYKCEHYNIVIYLLLNFLILILIDLCCESKINAIYRLTKSSLYIHP